jgi:hypothetical protein
MSTIPGLTRRRFCVAAFAECATQAKPVKSLVFIHVVSRRYAGIYECCFGNLEARKQETRLSLYGACPRSQRMVLRKSIANACGQICRQVEISVSERGLRLDHIDGHRRKRWTGANGRCKLRERLESSASSEWFVRRLNDRFD